MLRSDASVQSDENLPVKAGYQLATFLSEAESNSALMIKGIFSYSLFGHTVWITTTHVSVFIVVLLILIFALFAHHRMKHAEEVPGVFQNIIELIVEKLDGIVEANLGTHAPAFRNYINTVFIFILFCNLGGILGLRSPSADYGVTLPLGIITFFLIQINGIRANKWGYLKDLATPAPLTPINVIGEVAVPISLSLRLFGNVLSGTMIMGLWYSMMPALAKVFVSPFLHAYLDLFSGCIQTYVFCMLTMTYLSNKIGD